MAHSRKPKIPDNAYVLGTDDEELARLGVQHRVWRARALDAWRRARFTVGQTLLDLGAGPGYATTDLAEIVGPTGRIVAIDKSQRFLSHLQATLRQRKLDNVETYEIDLDTGIFPEVQVDGAWCRWVLAFLRNPRNIVQKIADSVLPGGFFVSHEYFAYDTWRFLPPSPELTEFVQTVSAGWRETGGEPDIGLQMPRWLSEVGFQIMDVRPIVEVVTPESYMWQWPKSFVTSGTKRYVELGTMTQARANAIVDAFERREGEANTMMITPGVLEIIARRRIYRGTTARAKPTPRG